MTIDLDALADAIELAQDARLFRVKSTQRSNSNPVAYELQDYKTNATLFKSESYAEVLAFMRTTRRHAMAQAAIAFIEAQ